MRERIEWRTGATRVLSCLLAGAMLVAPAAGQEAAPTSPRAVAPVDLTGYWVSVVSEDWQWRMFTPPKGNYASVPLNAEGRRVADTWSEAQDGSCRAFGAAALLRMPGRLRITWEDDTTLKIETDAGQQTRLLRFNPAAAPPSRRSLQGFSVAEWQMTTQVVGTGAGAGGLNRQVQRPAWASLKVVTTGMQAAWLRRNGVPYSENARLTEHFDAFTEGDDEWFSVTTIVEDPAYLTMPFIISSNFKREPDGAQWNPVPCR